jgi:uncharacterized protein (UPF0332 family)
MPFDWDDYRKLAEELKLRSDEAFWRTAVSRLYYAVYWKVRLHLEERENVIVPEKDAHAFVWKRFNGGGPTRQAICSYGKRLRDRRNQADYESKTFDSNVVEEAFAYARNVLTHLGQIQASQKR